MPERSTTIARANLPKISHGRGVRLWDTAGKCYLDGSSGPAVYCLGHAHPEVNDAIVQQLHRVAHGYRHTFTSDPLEELTDLTAAAAGADLRRMVFVSGGSEAVESCLKLALQYHSARGQSSRCHFISRRRSWHGNTLGALSLSGFEERRAPFEAALQEVTQLAPVNSYRPASGTAAEEVARVAAEELEAAIRSRGPEKVAAFIFEPVVGAAGGVVPAPEGYARRVREICDRFGVLMIADEVMCGCGRTGHWRALEYDGVAPDLMAIAKGLGGGYVPLGAAIYSEKVAEPIVAVYGGPMTGHTFTAHTLACAAGAAVQRIVRRDNLLDRVKEAGKVLQQALGSALAGLPYVGDIRGRGLFVGIELVADPGSKEPFPAESRLYQRVLQNALDVGLICYPSGGNVDGRQGDVIILAPPFISTDAELTQMTDLLSVAVRKSLQQIGAW